MGTSANNKQNPHAPRLARISNVEEMQQQVEMYIINAGKSLC